ncbi:hypothetical protein N7499_008989 [Penicillium canescens]|nr:hypothetical protein N7499_008989 [Penicillium canescens]KAJ6159320.1 hypothetical protein N7485_012146 [Penicillium canescens]
MGKPSINYGETGAAINDPAAGMPEPSELKMQEVHQRYDSERERRLRPDGFTQYVNFVDEPAPDLQPAEKIAIDNNLDQQKVSRVLIVGAGFGGLLFAVRLLQTGLCQPNELLLVDKAGGFGGTWRWNKYPGLTCDVESYTYMPLLDETNYTPSHKYVSGTELKEHAERIANQWKLKNQAFFRTKVDGMDWNDEDAQWKVHITTKNHLPTILKSDIVIMANGLLDFPKIPKLYGLDTYKGHVFHTSRWDYTCTRGSPDNPTMDKLHDKTVGFVGTGATAVQVIPHLAQWAKKVTIFQRTPSSEKGPGWQRGRMENFNSFISNDPQVPDVNLVDDAWTRLQTFSALIGSRSSLQPQYLTQMEKLDLHHQERIHRHIEATVTDPATAELLKPWYPSWCKRPCFSDNFLATFNRPNVSLIDTKGKGVQTLSDRGIIVDGTGYNVALSSSAQDTELGVTIISEADRGNSGTTRFNVEPSYTEEEEWTTQVLMRARALAGVGHCTPGYYNREGLQLDESEGFKAARSCIWGQGIKSYVETIEEWRQKSRLAGLDIQYR